MIKIPNLGGPADEKIDIVSTSSTTADASPIELSVSDYTRIRFIPILGNL